jgi:hypothetical protein
MEARARQCVGLYLDTFDPGAAQFYEHCGFLRFGQIDDFLPGHARAFLYKKLSAIQSRSATISAGMAYATAAI